MRCLALAETMSAFGFEPTFFSAAGSRDVARAAREANFPMRDTTGSGARDIEVSIGRAEVAVIDGYSFESNDEEELASVANCVVSFEDRPNRRHAAAVLVDPTPDRRSDAYVGLVLSGTTILSGRDYAIVRPLWREARRKGRDQNANRIVVSMGATDPANATARVIDALKAAAIPDKVDVVLGMAAPNRADVEARLGREMTLHIDPVDMPGLLRGAKLAVGAPGSSSFERAMLGLPSILVQTAENQSDIASAFDRAGAARLVPIADIENAEAFGAVIAALLADGELREKMSAAAAALCDGKGALRLIAALTGEARARDGSMLSLRLAEPDDRDWLFALQCKPETRRFARNPTLPSAEDHAKWYAQLMNDPDRTLLIIENDAQAVGFVRLDRRDGLARFEVSIAIEPANHGQGLGATALQLARRFAPGATFDATVLPANLSSRALFSSSGYRQIGPDLFRSVPN